MSLNLYIFGGLILALLLSVSGNLYQRNTVKAAKAELATATLSLSAALEANKGQVRLAASYAAELAERDKEDAELLAATVRAVEAAESRKRESDAVARKAIDQLQEMARRKPACKALLDTDVGAVCGT